MVTTITKMRISLILLFTVGTFAFAQNTGIGTKSPKATLEVKGTPGNTSAMDGIIPPRITGDQLRQKTYTTAQDGAIVYVTAAATGAYLSGQTENVKQVGVYFFDSKTNKWVGLKKEEVTTSSGVEHKKIQYYGAIDPYKTVVNGDFEFRTRVSYNSAGKRGMAYEMRPASGANFNQLTVYISSLSRIGIEMNDSNHHGGDERTYTWYRGNTAWQPIGNLAINRRGHFAYVSVAKDDGSGDPSFYFINAQRVWVDNTGRRGVKTLIVNRY
jgi:hypothetical protein